MPFHSIYNLMQRKHQQESSDDKSERQIARWAKRLKKEEEEQKLKRIDNKETLDFLTQKEEQGPQFWREIRHEVA